MELLQKFFPNFLCFILLVLLGCSKTPVPASLNQYIARLDDVKKQQLALRIQEDVNKKRPFQGSLRHRYKCDTLIALNHNVYLALQEKATPLIKIGDYHLAFSLLEEATELNPSEALYYYSWLLLYYFRDYEKALIRLNEFDDLTPNSSDVAWGENVNYLKGLSYKQLGQYENSIQQFSKAINDDGEAVDIYAYMYRGIAYFQNNQLDLALQDFDKVILEDANNGMVYYWKGQTLIKKQKLKEAQNNFEKSLTLTKKGYFKTDPYMELFDIPSVQQIEDTIKEMVNEL